MPRQPISVQEAFARTDQIATDARATAIALDTFLNSSSISDPVACSLLLRSRNLLKEATEFVDAAAQRLEMND